MAFMNDEQRAFTRSIAKLAMCNHFGNDRFDFVKEALGDDCINTGERWSWGPGSSEDDNQELLCERSEATAEALRARLKDGERPGPDEARAYIELVWWVMYHRSRDELRTHIEAQSSSTEPVDCRERYQEFRRLYDYYLDLDAIGPGLEMPAEHLFALFFQLRRAFYYIFYYMIGGSRPAGELRATVWESIFTHDRYRYLNVLYDRMGNLPTFITGETGTGKELIARAITFSRYIPYNRRQGTFVESYTSAFHALNLSALTPTLIESELFGHRRGAFTGAIEDRTGYLEDCSRLGTVFLDEIGELAPEIQVKLLRVLQDRSFNRLGDTKARQFQGKIIAATNRDMSTEMEAGRFREDLFYRLCADRIHVPSLREQLADAPSELENIILYIARQETNDAEAPRLVDQTASYIRRELGIDYPWPGNFRELGQCVRNVMIRNSYRPTRRSSSGARDNLERAAREGHLKMSELLRHYCSLVHAQTDNYQETARRLEVDHRTAKRHIDDGLLGGFR
ncbi:MAG: transcriptional regulator with AAA-type ATPase domain [Rhodothermales bacterium]|jgi:transcriptional regulator with AAA-type ATPase domain